MSFSESKDTNFLAENRHLFLLFFPITLQNSNKEQKHKDQVKPNVKYRKTEKNSHLYSIRTDKIDYICPLKILNK